jgi:hypothetical protein
MTTTMNYNIEDLHEEARELMIEWDTTYGMDNLISLDEYICEYRSIMNTADIDNGFTLLNKF